MSKLIKKSFVVLGALLVGSTAFAAPDFSQLSSGVDFSSAETAVISIGGAIAGLYIAIAGARAVLRMIK